MPEQINQMPDPDQKKTEENQETLTENKKFSAIRTLRSDISKYLKEGDVSIIDIAAEATKKRRFDSESDQSKKIIFLTLGIIIAIFGLIVGILFLFSQKNNPKEKNIQYQSIIRSESQEIINLKKGERSELLEQIKKFSESPILVGTILNFPITRQKENNQEIIDAENFFQILRIFPPPDFLQSINKNFSLGVFYLKKNNLFLVIEIRSFGLATRGLLDWEKNMARDFSEIFSIETLKNNENFFNDKIIKNYDARALYDSQKNSILIYAIIKQKYFILTPDIDTFEELCRRLSENI